MADSSYLHRAELLADLGRCDEAEAELAEAEPGDAPAQVLLARLRLVAGAPREALVAADVAVAAGPHHLPALAVRARALAALGRTGEAVDQAEQLLRRGRGDAFACTQAAAVLADARAGQVALDAAWEGVRLAPDDPGAHLVLGVVAARLGRDDIAARGYEEALALDPQLPDVPPEAGLTRLEHRRYAALLARHTGAGSSGGKRPGSGAAGAAAAAGHPAGSGRSAGVSPPVGDPPAGGADPWPEVGLLRRLLRRGAGAALAGSVLVGWAALTGVAAPLLAVLLAGAAGAGLVVAHRRLSAQQRAGLAARVGADRSLRVSVWALFGVPVLLFLFAVFDAPALVWLAVAAAAVAFVASRERGVAQ